MVDSANLFSMQRTARGTLLFAEAEPAAWCGVARSIRSRISRNHAADFGVLVSTCPTRIWQASTNDRNASRSIEPLPALPRLDGLDFESPRPGPSQPERDRAGNFSVASPRIIACSSDLPTRVAANRKAQFEANPRSN